MSYLGLVNTFQITLNDFFSQHFKSLSYINSLAPPSQLFNLHSTASESRSALQITFNGFPISTPQITFNGFPFSIPQITFNSFPISTQITFNGFPFSIPQITFNSFPISTLQIIFNGLFPFSTFQITFIGVPFSTLYPTGILNISWGAVEVLKYLITCAKSIKSE